jgi:glycine cleavage system protein P-like pyridoxal-binding family
MKGYEIMINELGEMLKSITTFDAVSLQPNSGANVNFL